MNVNLQILQSIWQYQHFLTPHLKFDNDQRFWVIHPGRLDKTGHCFLDAKIHINDTLWVGNILLYVGISDLLDNAKDRNLDKVLFYVVWNNDRPSFILKKLIFSMMYWCAENTVEKFKRLLTIDSFVLPTAPLEDHSKTDKTNDTTKNSNEPAKIVNINSKVQETTVSTEDEEKVIHYLHEYLDLCKKKVPIIKGDIRNLKIIEWHQQTERFYPQFGGHCKHIPKIQLLGNWLTKAGFDCNERVRIIPLDKMLIIIPNKQ